ncbi:MAG: hypothetical protein IH624_19380 [Phycisphaerae bacterium]|nr:hypothetical protein [Phycisphaerae bacterium]
MNKDNEQLDALENKVAKALGEDLKALFSPAGRTPDEVDRAVLDATRKRLVRPRRHRWRLVRAGAAAMAAVVLLAVVLNVTRDHVGRMHPAATATAPADIDHNGRIDILDAYKLARRLEGPGALEARWDLNADGQVDRADVDLVAFAAVRLDGGA